MALFRNLFHLVKITNNCAQPKKLGTVTRGDMVVFVNLEPKPCILTGLGSASQTRFLALEAGNRPGSIGMIKATKSGTHEYSVYFIEADRSISPGCGGAGNEPEMIVGG